MLMANIKLITCKSKLEKRRAIFLQRVQNPRDKTKDELVFTSYFELIVMIDAGTVNGMKLLEGRDQ